MTRVSEIMTRDPAVCTPQSSLQDAAREMLDCDCGEIPVIDAPGSRIVLGVITDRDIVLRSLAQGRDPLQMKVAECMSSPAITATEQMAVEDCLQLMQDHQVRRLPVVDEQGHLAGIVSQADIAARMSPRETGKMVREVSQPNAGVA